MSLEPSRTVELAHARDRAEVLMAEINHRVSNSLALVSSLVNLQARALVDREAKEAFSETRDRILAISLVHKRLYSSENARFVALDAYLEGLLDHLYNTMGNRDSGVTLSHKIDPIQLGTDASVSLGVLVTELVTNSFKYAYPGKDGEIRVRLSKLPDECAELIVEDDGVGRCDDKPLQGTGLGTKIINAMCANMGGKIEYTRQRVGTAARLVFPAKTASQGQNIT
jgi:two-component sensor histidine kinase